MSVARNTIYNVGGFVLPMAVSLLTIPIYIATIGLERYGVLAVVWALLAYFSFCDLGFGRALTQRMSRLSSASESERSVLLWTALIATCCLGSAAALIGWVLVDIVLPLFGGIADSNRSQAVSAVAWLLMALPILIPISALTGALQARGRFAEINIVQIAGSIATQLFPLGVALLGYTDVTALVPAALVSRLAVVGLLFGLCRRHVPLVPGRVFSMEYMASMLSYGGWVSVMAVLAPLLVTVDRLVIASVSGARAVTVYTIPFDLVSKSQAVSTSLANAIFPRLASTSASESEELAHRAAAALIAVMSPLVVAGLLFVHPAISIWLGRDFASDSSGVAEIILFGVWVNSLVIPHHARYMATRNPRNIAIIYLLEIPIYFLMLYILLTKFGIIGAALAWSGRIVMDTTALLILNGAFLKTIRISLVPFLLVSSAFFLSFERFTSAVLHWAMGSAVLILVLYIGRGTLVTGLKSMSRRTAAA
ncbi:MAG: hypothetical protein EOR00_30915 [Mesorhizobium sp.]|uniref:oligosaccharide flippase family protein n=1 Tax=Mesorhizobium sp. TaxID=1871066 RepID=UPI000FE78819|nr:oligosaccharide flippase family protein [Mesorhizobium sp.]RWP10325.1 MAG: hypothetical protein EOR00_30915 [Mesorhizobium sp.]